MRAKLNSFGDQNFVKGAINLPPQMLAIPLAQDSLVVIRVERQLIVFDTEGYPPVIHSVDDYADDFFELLDKERSLTIGGK